MGGRVCARGSLRLHAEPGSLPAAALPAAGLPLLPIAQVAAVFGAAVLAGICFAGIRGRLRRDAEAYSHAGWRLVLLIGAPYVAVSLALLATGGPAAAPPLASVP